MLSRWWRQWRDERLLRQRPIPDALWLDTLRAHRFLTQRPTADLLRLRELSTLFLARKEFTAVEGLTLTDDIAVAVATQACVPILELGLRWYDGFVGIVMQPDEVVAAREWTDDDGIVHTGTEVLAGEAMPGGPVMLSWPDVQQAGDLAASGYNLVIHEFVHLIDMCDGRDADGIPPLPSRAARTQWQDVMARAHAKLCDAVTHGEATFLDPYGTQGLEEFFPVAAEAFFVAPIGLRAEHPEVYGLLRGFFRQDPAIHVRP